MMQKKSMPSLVKMLMVMMDSEPLSHTMEDTMLITKILGPTCLSNSGATRMTSLGLPQTAATMIIATTMMMDKVMAMVTIMATTMMMETAMTTVMTTVTR